jgi:hypothetical protein
MDKVHRVQIIAVPVACSDGFKDTWREVAEWVAGQLHNRFGDAVRTEYYDLFDTACPTIPPDAQLPVILVDGQALDSCGKISVPAIRKRLEDLGAYEIER